MEHYLHAQSLFNEHDSLLPEPEYTSDIINLNLNHVNKSTPNSSNTHHNKYETRKQQFGMPCYKSLEEPLKIKDISNAPCYALFSEDSESESQDAALIHRRKDAIVLAGHKYGSQDFEKELTGIKAVIAESYEVAHRRNLVNNGVLPLQFKDGETATSLGLNIDERLTIPMKSGQF